MTTKRKFALFLTFQKTLEMQFRISLGRGPTFYSLKISIFGHSEPCLNRK